jgi:hypothetical protein
MNLTEMELCAAPRPSRRRNSNNTDRRLELPRASTPAQTSHSRFGAAGFQPPSDYSPGCLSSSAFKRHLANLRRKTAHCAAQPAERGAGRMPASPTRACQDAENRELASLRAEVA